MSKKKLAVECNPDEELLRKLGFSKKEIVHQSSIGDVCNYIKGSETNFAMIDEDPLGSHPKYLTEFTTIEEKHNTKKLVHPQSGKTIIVLKPRLEEWVYEQCTQANVNPEDFFFPKEAKQFKAVINKRLDSYSKMVEALLVNKSPGLAYLKSELNRK